MIISMGIFAIFAYFFVGGLIGKISQMTAKSIVGEKTDYFEVRIQSSCMNWLCFPYTTWSGYINYDGPACLAPLAFYQDNTYRAIIFFFWPVKVIWNLWILLIAMITLTVYPLSKTVTLIIDKPFQHFTRREPRIRASIKEMLEERRTKQKMLLIEALNVEAEIEALHEQLISEQGGSPFRT